MLQSACELVTRRQRLCRATGSPLTTSQRTRIKEVMKIFTLFVLSILLTGCAGRHPRGTARYDAYDSVKVEQMVGNHVAQNILAKTILCLNARRETRDVTALTNTVVTSATNQSITAITNLTISLSTNLLYTVMTNLTAALPAPPVAATEGSASTGEPPPTVVPGAPLAALTTNVTISVANNASGTRAPSQFTANLQTVRTFNNQLTTSSNNLSVATMTNLVLTGETNLLVTYLTNTAITSVTNTLVTTTNGVTHDYFLYTELIPPPDFTPQTQGETLVLLVDGVRHGFTPGQSGTAFVARKGYTTAIYKVSGEVLTDIANAKEVRLRLKGVNNVVERTLSGGSRQNFRAFLARYFVPEKPLPASGQAVASSAESTQIINR